MLIHSSEHSQSITGNFFFADVTFSETTGNPFVCHSYRKLSCSRAAPPCFLLPLPLALAQNWAQHRLPSPSHWKNSYSQSIKWASQNLCRQRSSTTRFYTCNLHHLYPHRPPHPAVLRSVKVIQKHFPCQNN